MCGTKGHRAAECTRRCKSCGLKNCGGVRGADKCMTLTGIPPGKKLPDSLRAAIEKRAAELKTGGKAMLAQVGSDTDEEEFESVNGAAFVAKAI